MLRLAYEHGKLMRLPVLKKLKEAGARQGFFEPEQYQAVRGHLAADLQVITDIAYTYGWRMQNEVLVLERRQLDLTERTLRLDPGTIKNNEGRVIYLTPALAEALAAQVKRVEQLSRKLGRIIPFLFPHLAGRAPRDADPRLPEGLGHGVQGRRHRGPAPPRLPPYRRPQHGQPGRRRARGHDGHRAQDARRVRLLPHREPRGSARRRHQARGKRDGQRDGQSEGADPETRPLTC